MTCLPLAICLSYQISVIIPDEMVYPDIITIQPLGRLVTIVFARSVDHPLTKIC